MKSAGSYGFVDPEVSLVPNDFSGQFLLKTTSDNLLKVLIWSGTMTLLSQLIRYSVVYEFAAVDEKSLHPT